MCHCSGSGPGTAMRGTRRVWKTCDILSAYRQYESNFSLSRTLFRGLSFPEREIIRQFVYEEHKVPHRGWPRDIAQKLLRDALRGFESFVCWVGEVRVLHSDLPCYVEPWGGFVAISRSTTRPLQRFETRKIEGVLLTQIQDPSRWHSDIVEKYRGELTPPPPLQSLRTPLQRMLFGCRTLLHHMQLTGFGSFLHQASVSLSSPTK